MKKSFHHNAIKVALFSSMLALTACGDNNDAPKGASSVTESPVTETPATESPATTSATTQTSAPLSLKVLHINDHHSHLAGMSGQDLTLDGFEFSADIGGFPYVKTKIEELSKSGNVLKLHAGDAITGTMYYSLFRDELPDAVMMNDICFDAFEIGNHEFDDGNEQLANFIGKLTSGSCNTQVLGANIEVPESNVISGLYKPYTTFEFEGQTIGMVGLDISAKTKASSSPSEDTNFLDETETAQKYIDELKGKGIDKIILLTHYTYENDQVLAANLTDVDVIVGGDSHSLLGDSATFSAIGYGSPEGEYPTITKNKDGDNVCIVQAMDNARVVGELNINFSADGKIESCAGTPHLLVNQGSLTKDVKVTVDGREKKEAVALTTEEVAKVQAGFDKLAGIDFVAADQALDTKLKDYSAQYEAKMSDVIGNSSALLCNERVPGQVHSSGSACAEGTTERAFLNAHGGVMAHIVSKAFYEMSLRADLTIQNSGGVRTTIDAGPITTGEAFNVLPFTNMLVNLDLTGQEIVNVLEDSIDFSGTSTGAFPSTYNLRFDVDMTKEKGKRVTNVEARKRGETEWKAIDLAANYVVVTNDYIAAGKDGYTSFIPAFKDDSRREDTGLLYTDSLLNYIKKLAETDKPLEHPVAENMGVQSFTAAK